MSYVLPRPDDCFDAIGQAKHFSAVDLSSAYWSLPLATEEDRKKTAFASPVGNYQFKVLPFGWKNSPAVFAQFMAMVLSNTRFVCTVHFFDDILIYSNTAEQHLKDISHVLGLLIEHGCSIKAEKCSFFFKRAKFLGHMIDATGVGVCRDKAEAIKKMNPKTAKELKSFVHLCSYYRKFIRNFSAITAPLQALIARGSKIKDDQVFER